VAGAALVCFRVASVQGLPNAGMRTATGPFAAARPTTWTSTMDRGVRLSVALVNGVGMLATSSITPQFFPSLPWQATIGFVLLTLSQGVMDWTLIKGSEPPRRCGGRSRFNSARQNTTGSPRTCTP